MSVDPIWRGVLRPHDVFACDCHETCSWCTEPVPVESLREAADGALVCPRCMAQQEGGARR